MENDNLLVHISLKKVLYHINFQKEFTKNDLVSESLAIFALMGSIPGFSTTESTEQCTGP